MTYKGHDTTTILVSLPALLGMLYLGKPLEDAVALFLGLLFGGMMLSPDLDIQSRIYERWGIFKYYWLPYQKLIPHRSPLSHSGVSSLIRLMYLFTPLATALYAFSPEVLASLLITNYTMFFSFVAGVFIADIVHCFFDMVV